MTTGQFQFMSPDSRSSLYRDGRVKMVRDAQGNTASYSGVDLTVYDLGVTNARDLDTVTCEANGFELAHQPLEQPELDFLDHHRVIETYYPQCEALVREYTGAQVFAFDHNVRSATGKASEERIKGGQDVQGPAHVVHGDYTLRSGVERLLQLTEPPTGNDTLAGLRSEPLFPKAFALDALGPCGRFAIINVWRNIRPEPVVTHPMAFCDAQSVGTEELVVFELHYPNRVGENYFAKHTEQHRMYWYPEVTRDEPLLIKQWDSAGGLARSRGQHGDAGVPEAPCTFSFHSAFVDPNAPDDGPDRWSIEVRCMVIY